MKNILIIAFIGLLVSNLSAQDIKIENGLYCKAGVAYTGEASIKDASGAISLINVLDGNLQGTAHYYYSDGKIKEEGAYVAGLKSGIWIRYNETGLKVGEGQYFNGKKHGKWFVWDDNGNKRFEMNYLNGYKYSNWYSWDEKGELVASTNYDKG
jgi:antitoxin component YwqK of YwqJK toxin-antitoxin module